MPKDSVRRGPIHPFIYLAFACGLLAAALSLYGSFLSEQHLDGSALNSAQGRRGIVYLNESKTRRYLVQIAAYFLPFTLGLLAAILAGTAMRTIERDPRGYSGSLPAVFTILIGGLASVVSGCMIYSVYLWRYVPQLYTT